jgi:hypothetical protein
MAGKTDFTEDQERAGGLVLKRRNGRCADAGGVVALLERLARESTALGRSIVPLRS